MVKSTSAQNLASLVLHDLRDMGCLLPPREVDLILEYFADLFSNFTEEQIHSVLGTDKPSGPGEE